MPAHNTWYKKCRSIAYFKVFASIKLSSTLIDRRFGIGNFSYHQRSASFENAHFICTLIFKY